MRVAAKSRRWEFGMNDSRTGMFDRVDILSMLLVDDMMIMGEEK